MKYLNFPEELRNQKQWVMWKKEIVGNKTTKVPYKNTAQKASSTKQEDWKTFNECLKLFETKQFEGLGFVFKEGGQIVGIDLDHCFTEEKVLKPWAKKIIELFGSYIEYSPSGNGLHILLKCSADFKGAKTYIEGGDVERYCRGRYFTVTGDVYENYNELKEFKPEYFLEWHNSFIKTEILPNNQIHTNETLPEDDKILSVAFKSKAGSKIKDLYDGKWELYYKSQSEADLALTGYLMFFCSNNSVTVDRIFRTSGLMRLKWSRKDYREAILQKGWSLETMKWNISDEKQKDGKIQEHKIVSLNDILKMTPKENPFLLGGMIVEGSVNALTSDSGKGKSLLMLKMIEAIAVGEKFLGEFETKKSKTLIIDLEMSEDDIVERTQSIIGQETEGIDFHHCQSFNILDDNDFKWLKEVISENGYKLIVLDTYSMAAGSKNENDNAEANLINKRFLELTNVCGVTILFLHHHRKLQKGEIMSQSTSRGATDIIGKTASHLLIDTRDVTIADQGEGIRGIKIVVEQMKRRKRTGFDRFAVIVYYNPLEKRTIFSFSGYDEKAENALQKTKGVILGKMQPGEEYMMKHIKDMANKDSHCVYAAIKELVEVDKIVNFRYPATDETLENGHKIPAHTKIYYLEAKKDVLEGMEGM